MTSTSLLLALGVLALAAAPLFPELRQPPPPPTDGFAALTPLDRAADGQVIATPDAWATRRAQIDAAWRALLGPFPERVPLETQVLSTEELPDHTRLLLRYQNEAGHPNDAYLLIPKDGRAQHPGMVVLHQTTVNTIREPVGLDGRDSMHIALKLVRRGYVCIAPRCFVWGYGGADPTNIGEATRRLLADAPWKTGMAKMTWDAIRAADVLAARPEVDPARLGSIGHSLGGKETIYHAAFDARIRATVSCEGGVGLTFSNWHDPWYLGAMIRADGFAPDNHEVISLIAPRAFLLVGGESADGAQSWPYIAANLPVWRALGAEERLGLQRHGDGHNFPPNGAELDATFAWLDHWLEHTPPAPR